MASERVGTACPRLFHDGARIIDARNGLRLMRGCWPGWSHLAERDGTIQEQLVSFEREDARGPGLGEVEGQADDKQDRPARPRCHARSVSRTATGLGWAHDLVASVLHVGSRFGFEGGDPVAETKDENAVARMHDRFRRWVENHGAIR